MPRPLRRAALAFGAVLVALTAACGGGATDAVAGTGVPTAVAGSPQRIEIRFARGDVQGGVPRIAVALRAPVRLVVTSDVADEVHLHGYDKHVDVPTGGTVELDFVADVPGVFEVELESLGERLAQLQVS